MASRRAGVVSWFSARPDGATSLAVGLSAVLSSSARTLLIDLSSQRSDIPTLLDVGESPGLHDLAFAFELTSIASADLERHVQWREGLGILPGVGDPSHAPEADDRFVDRLVDVAAQAFDWVVIDLGRPRVNLPDAIANGSLLWAVAPTALGVAAFDRTITRLAQARPAWRPAARVVLNKVDGLSWQGVDTMIDRFYGMKVVGEVPWVGDYWRALEVHHSTRALSASVGDTRTFRRAHGVDALPLRRALDDLARRLPVPAAASTEAPFPT